VAQPGHDPALDDLDRHLGLGFVLVMDSSP